MSNAIKLIAAFRAGYLGENILDSYFSFFANMLYEEQITVVEDEMIEKMFIDRYSIELPLPFIRQVLGTGVQKGCFIDNRGKYNVVIEEIKKYCFNNNDFNNKWDNLINKFESYCQKQDINTTSCKTSEFILNILDYSDERILSGEKVVDNHNVLPIEYAWYCFIKEQGESNTDLYSFVSALSASNITKQALFYSGDKVADYSELHVYLDSPIIFALLGMDEVSRTESYKRLINDMLKAKCNIHILDHNFQEVDSIIARAASWATSTQYDLRKANNAARFFHDSQMSNIEITEFCNNIELKLNELGITVKETSYDIYQNNFQEDENCLFEMVKARYRDNGYELSCEREESIRVDVRSIIMIYRERQGQTATKLQKAKHIMLTSNNAIANVSKKYESNRNTKSMHIPACISADLFGAILWLDSPLQMQEYQKKKLLADCYAFLKPDKFLLDKYIQSLDEARNQNALNEKEFLFLRTHKVVLDSLMDVTKGDYARFNSHTYLEVYDDIQAKSQKQYQDEVDAHAITREKLEKTQGELDHEKEKSKQEIGILQEKISCLEDKEKKRQEKEFEDKVQRLGWGIFIIFVLIPYILVVGLIEIIKAQFSDLSWRSYYSIIALSLLTIIVGLLFDKGKKLSFRLAKKYIIYMHQKEINQ